MATALERHRMAQDISAEIMALNLLIGKAVVAGITADLAIVEYQGSPVILFEWQRPYPDAVPLAERLAASMYPDMMPIPPSRVRDMAPAPLAANSPAASE